MLVELDQMKTNNATTLVINGLQEGTDPVKDVHHLFRTLDDNSILKQDIADATRLGESQPSRPRPLLVRLSSPAACRKLRALRKLLPQNTSTKMRVFISEDLSKDERQRQGELRPYLKRLREGHNLCFMRRSFIEIPRTPDHPRIILRDKDTASALIVSLNLPLPATEANTSELSNAQETTEQQQSRSQPPATTKSTPKATKSNSSSSSSRSPAPRRAKHK